jgi:alkylation response protein AidB-like acyl-CoA dehydrogenase
MAMQTTARRTEGGYVLDGAKRWITLGPISDLALVFATTDPDRGMWGITAFLVETKWDGCELQPVRDKMGLRTVPMGDVVFADCFVPEENRLGPEGAGATISSGALAVERCFILSSQVGNMEYQLERAIEYAKTRRQFGKPIGKFQSVSNRIADMKLKLETSRLLLYKVGWMISQGQPVTLDSSLLKLHLSESLVESSLDASPAWTPSGSTGPGDTYRRQGSNAISATPWAASSTPARPTSSEC